MQAKHGNKVKVQFTGRLEDGTVFGQATPEKPMEFTVGQGEVIPGFEEAVLDMEPGQNKTVLVPPEKAFGMYDQSKVVTAKRDQLPMGEPLAIGSRVGVYTRTGERLPAMVEDLTESTVTLNFNHPLAGHKLNFDLRLLEVA